MTDQPNILQETFDVFVSNPGNPQKSVTDIIALGGLHLDTAISYGGMMMMMIMAARDYNDPRQVWETVANYEDLKHSWKE